MKNGYKTRMEILKVLRAYAVENGGFDKALTEVQLSERLGCQKEELKFTLRYLDNLGLILNPSYLEVRITPHGVLYYDDETGKWKGALWEIFKVLISVVVGAGIGVLSPILMQMIP